MTTLQLIPHLAPIARTATTVGAVGSEVLTAGAILAALNLTSTAIEKTYSAGRMTRRVVDATLIPAADAISWLLAQIDWAEVGATLWTCLLTVATALYVAGEFTGRTVKTWHANHVGQIKWTVEQDIEDCTFDGLSHAIDFDATYDAFIEASAPEMDDELFAVAMEETDLINQIQAAAEVPTRDLAGLKVVELRKMARKIGTKGTHKMRKAELIEVLA